MKNEVIIPLKPRFYRRYVDDIFNQRKRNVEDTLSQRFNLIKLNCFNGIYKTMIHRKTTKLPTHWSSKVPKRYKCNAILVTSWKNFKKLITCYISTKIL